MQSFGDQDQFSAAPPVSGLRQASSVLAKTPVSVSLEFYQSDLNLLAQFQKNPKQNKKKNYVCNWMKTEYTRLKKKKKRLRVAD